MAWTRGLGPGTMETIPIVHNGVIYVIEPGGIVQALDGDQRRSAVGVQTQAGECRGRPDDGEDEIAGDLSRTSCFTPRPTASLSDSTRARASSAGRRKQVTAANISGGIVVDGKMISGTRLRQDARHLLHRRA